MRVVNGILLLALISLLGACSSTTGVQTYNTSDTASSSVQSSYQPSNGYVGVIVNLTKWHWYRLPANDRLKQEQAMYFALVQMTSAASERNVSGDRKVVGTSSCKPRRRHDNPI